MSLISYALEKIISEIASVVKVDAYIKNGLNTVDDYLEEHAVETPT